MNCFRWSMGDVSSHGIESLLAPKCGAKCYPCPRTVLLPLSLDRTVSGTNNHVELDCALGDFAGAITAPSFQVIGTFVREHAGPIAIGEVPDTHPALYVGSVSAGTMTLTIRLTDSSDSGTAFTLMRGTTGRVVKCL